MGLGAWVRFQAEAKLPSNVRPPHGLDHPPLFRRASAVSAYKNQQRRLSLGQREFHFVTYEARPANVKRGETESGPMWYLMRAGKRWPVMPEVPGQVDTEITQALTAWLKEQGIS